MKQKHLPDAWYLNEGDKVEVNGKNFSVTQIESLVGEEEIKTFYLDQDNALEVTESGKIKFFKVERPTKNTEEFHDLELKSIKILK